MLVMGGQLVTPERTECDVPAAFGQHGMLLGQESIELGSIWYGLQPDISKYRVPSNIVAVVGGRYVFRPEVIYISADTR